MRKKIRAKKCRTVGQLITELQKFPPHLPLSDGITPQHYNYGKEAKEMGLKEQVGLEDDFGM